MADVTTAIPDALILRLEEYLSSTHQDMDGFIASAVDEKLARSHDAELSARVTQSIDASLKDIEVGRVVDAREGMRSIAAECGIKLDK